jgi:hypothetical protein
MNAGQKTSAKTAIVLPDGGVAGATLRQADWSTNALGAVGDWPASLKAIVRAMLSTRQATCLFWGPELINLYNDGFIPLLGEKHPRAMGQRAEDCWSDAWPVVGGLLADVVAHGKAVLFEEMLVPIVRGGRLEDAWWNYSYSPVFDDDGAIAGVLVVATETTAEVAGRRQLEAAKSDAELARQELHAVFMQAPLPMALFKGAEHSFSLVNQPFQALVAREVVDKTLSEAFSEEEAGYYRRPRLSDGRADRAGRVAAATSGPCGRRARSFRRRWISSLPKPRRRSGGDHRHRSRCDRTGGRAPA